MIIGKSGWDKIIELGLNSSEKDLFASDAVRNMNNALGSI